MSDEKQIRVWQIGPDGTEYYAAFSEQEMRSFYRSLLGSRPEDQREAEHDLKHHFDEVENLDEEFEFNDDGQKLITTWRKLAATATSLPCQISTGYN